MNYLANNLRLLRNNISKRQEDIGLLVDKGQTTIVNWESGKTEPNIEELLVISNFFDISVDILLKIDLARTNFLSSRLTNEEDHPSRKENPTKYSHNEWESLVKEYDEKILSHILLEIRSLRYELNQSRNDDKTEPGSNRKAGKKTVPQKKPYPSTSRTKPSPGHASPGPPTLKPEPPGPAPLAGRPRAKPKRKTD